MNNEQKDMNQLKVFVLSCFLVSTITLCIIVNEVYQKTGGYAMAATQIQGDQWLQPILPITMHVTVINEDPNIPDRKTRFVFTREYFLYPKTPYSGSGLMLRDGEIEIRFTFQAELFNMKGFAEVVEK